jgi:hypothetical protein
MRGAVAHTTAVLYPLSNPQRVWHGASAIYAPADPPPPPLFAPCPATSFGALRAGEILDPPPGWNAVLCDHWYLPATLLTTLPLSTTQTPLMYSPRAPPHSMASPCFQQGWSLHQLTRTFGELTCILGARQLTSNLHPTYMLLRVQNDHILHNDHLLN